MRGQLPWRLEMPDLPSPPRPRRAGNRPMQPVTPGKTKPYEGDDRNRTGV